MNWLQRIRHPELFHGQRARPPFFEGWYYKLVSADLRHRYAVIPAIILSDDPGESHAFVHILDGSNLRVTYHTYAMEDFEATEDRLDVRVGPNTFTEEVLSLDINSDELTIRGEVCFQNTTPWPVSLASPGAMGPLGWVPSLECNHGVLSLDHSLQGTLEVDGIGVSLDGGRGYIEKDWGRSFPSAWVWMQTNHFERPGTSLTASVATVPVLGLSLLGQVVGLWHEGRLYRFTTYTGSRVEALSVSSEEVNLVLRQRGHRLEIRALRAKGGVLRGPARGNMGRRLEETLSAEIEVRLSEIGRQGSRTVFHGSGRCGGLEVAGDLRELVN